MSEYPQNRKYCVLPIARAKEICGADFARARKSLDGKFVVWDFKLGAEDLRKVEKDFADKIYSHAEILKVMNGKNWFAPDVDGS